MTRAKLIFVDGLVANDQSAIHRLNMAIIPNLTDSDEPLPSDYLRPHQNSPTSSVQSGDPRGDGSAENPIIITDTISETSAHSSILIIDTDSSCSSTQSTIIIE